MQPGRTRDGFIAHAARSHTPPLRKPAKIFFVPNDPASLVATMAGLMSLDPPNPCRTTWRGEREKARGKTRSEGVDWPVWLQPRFRTATAFSTTAKKPSASASCRLRARLDVHGNQHERRGIKHNLKSVPCGKTFFFFFSCSRCCPTRAYSPSDWHLHLPAAPNFLRRDSPDRSLPNTSGSDLMSNKYGLRRTSLDKQPLVGANLPP